MCASQVEQAARGEDESSPHGANPPPEVYGRDPLKKAESSYHRLKRFPRGGKHESLKKLSPTSERRLLELALMATDRQARSRKARMFRIA